MGYKKDNPIVMTLDAGGSSFVFSAIQNFEEIIAPVSVSFKGQDLTTTLLGIIEQFRAIEHSLPKKSIAISFGFPGPCDYPRGIVGDLENLPAFRGGVALGAMLKNEFHIPVYINNDADLFAYGESIKGLLPAINHEFETIGSPTRFKNLFGVTIGTGFGGAIVSNNELFIGDNAVSGEINRMGNKLYPEYSVEESISIRGLQRVFAREAGFAPELAPDPKDIYEIARGKQAGNQNAALRAFDEFSVVLAQSLVDSITLIDGIIAIGGGLSGAADIFLPKTVEEMRKPYKTAVGTMLTRLEVDVYNLDDPAERAAFIKGNVRTVAVPFSQETIQYDPLKRIGVGTSLLNTSKATAIGAYAFALCKLKG